MEIQFNRLLATAGWEDYELIDSGQGEKLERFGSYILARPEPQAVWAKHLPPATWAEMADATFTRSQAGGGEKGDWVTKKHMPDQWMVQYAYKGMFLKFRLGMTAFKHVGLFPEQAANWHYIYDTLTSWPQPQTAQVLNLFAYTGGASLAAKAAGALVTHVDSVKQVITWSRENMEASGLEGIRWMVEDALKFVKREVKRGRQYQGIILDPPAYGRGPDGEKWVLEDQILELMAHCGQLLDPARQLVVANLYSMGYSGLILDNLMQACFKGSSASMEQGELYTPDRVGRKLPLGIYARMRLV
jgi:23S rRNA (cytosine1962-C5)-methyltransferase